MSREAPPWRQPTSFDRPPSWVGFRWLATRLGLVLLLLVSGTFAYVLWTLRDLPAPGSRPVFANSIVVYDRTGRQIEQRNSEGAYYVPLTLAQMGRWGPAATLAAEDREFYHHGAIDWGRTASAAAHDVLHQGQEQGGSTITQQLVKIDVLTPQRSIFRKMQEAVLAEGMEHRYSKDQILEMYLNEVNYGHNAYGLGAAAKVYFGKAPSDLDPAQAAFLAGIINGPSLYDPQTNYEGARARELYVLDGMVKTGALSEAEAAQAAQKDLQPELKFDQSLRRSLAPHFVDYVIGKLEQTVGAAAVQHGGFKVYTTLDLDLQAQAERAVQRGVARLRYTGVNNADLLAANPSTGEVLAYVGSADYYSSAIGGQFDVIRSPRQPGSSFKPYVYEAALKDHRITLATTLQDQPTDFGGGYRPLDFDNRFMGDISARRALLLSRNVPAVQVGQMEGMGNVIRLASQMGINPAELKDVPSAAIGSSDITMFENLQGYQVFADQGRLVPLMTITKITDASDNVLFQQRPGEQAGIDQPLTPAEAYLITDTLKDYPGYWELGWRRKMAGKSGTTGGSQTGVHQDAWMMGYSPDIVVGAWAGNTTAGGGAPKPISTFGTQVGQQILAPFVNSLPPPAHGWYQQPPGIVAGAGCPGGGAYLGREIFLTGTEQTLECPSPSPSPSPSDNANGDNGNGNNGGRHHRGQGQLGVPGFGGGGNPGFGGAGNPGGGNPVFGNGFPFGAGNGNGNGGGRT